MSTDEPRGASMARKHGYGLIMILRGKALEMSHKQCLENTDALARSLHKACRGCDGSLNLHTFDEVQESRIKQDDGNPQPWKI